MPAMVTTIIVMVISFPRTSFTSDETGGTEGSDEEGLIRDQNSVILSWFLYTLLGFGV